MKECKHVAIIMDGNGRWAKAKGMPRTAGHKVGADNVRTIAIAANELGVKYLTLYAFSTENWKRAQEEVNYLMKLPAYLFKMYMKEFLERGFRIRLIGDLSALPEATRKVLLDAAKQSENNTGLSLIIAINYGSRDEIRRAVVKIAEKAKAGEIDPEKIEEETISENLDTADFPDVDLLIRTSGEQRISNYLLWQIAYAELEFVPESWPEFTPEVLARCIDEYQHRDRRFGGVKDE
ncbi:MAG: isoprenyl transferase [Solobacterium sp.]|nr:isoprenyl transferase [Solobacterium sp.]